jgi:hypothetical protein
MKPSPGGVRMCGVTPVCVCVCSGVTHSHSRLYVILCVCGCVVASLSKMGVVTPLTIFGKCVCVCVVASQFTRL